MQDTMLILHICFTVHWFLFQVVLDQGVESDVPSAQMCHSVIWRCLSGRRPASSASRRTTLLSSTRDT